MCNIPQNILDTSRTWKFLTYLKIRRKNTSSISYNNSYSLVRSFPYFRVTRYAYIGGANIHTEAYAVVIATFVRRCYLAGVSGASLVAAVSHSVSDWPRVRTRYRTNELWSLFEDLHTDSLYTLVEVKIGTRRGATRDRATSSRARNATGR